MKASLKKSPILVADQSGVGSITWADPLNARELNQAFATVVSSSGNLTSHYLRASRFGFKIPRDATILGIVVEIEKKESASEIVDNVVKLAWGNQLSSENNAIGNEWPTSERYFLYGGPTDLWGETWDAVDINDPNFGVVVSATANDVSKTAYIDHIRITVYYEAQQKFGIKVAQKGINVLTNTDSENLIFSSGSNSLKVLAKGEISITTDGVGVGVGVIEHGLGFAPTLNIFRKGTTAWQRQNPSEVDAVPHPNAYFSNPGTPHNWINYHSNTRVYSDEENLTIYVEGAAGTTYTFLYYIFADLAEEYEGDTPIGAVKTGIKIAFPGGNAATQKVFQLGFSSRFRALKYNPVKSQTLELSLPKIYGSAIDDPTPEEAQYGEIIHGQGYPPFFLAFFKFGSENVAHEVGFGTKSPYMDLGYDFLEQCVDSWCDATRIRFSFWRKAYFVSGDEWPAETLSIKCLVFDEDLSDI